VENLEGGFVCFFDETPDDVRGVLLLGHDGQLIFAVVDQLGGEGRVRQFDHPLDDPADDVVEDVLFVLAAEQVAQLLQLLLHFVLGAFAGADDVALQHNFLPEQVLLGQLFCLFICYKINCLLI
jgi:hypothetical protein